MEQGKALGVFVDFSRIDTQWITRAHTLDQENLIYHVLSYAHVIKRPRLFSRYVWLAKGLQVLGRNCRSFFTCPCPSGKAVQTRLRRTIRSCRPTSTTLIIARSRFNVAFLELFFSTLIPIHVFLGQKGAECAKYQDREGCGSLPTSLVEKKCCSSTKQASNRYRPCYTTTSGRLSNTKI
jgi:hypothetical protein